MNGSGRYWFLTGSGRRTAVIAAAAALALLGPVSGALASPRALSAGSQATGGSARAPRTGGVLTASSAGGPGWAAVPYRNAQLSVPGSWLVESAQQLSCGFSQSPGMIFAGIRPKLPASLGCSLPASVAWILPARHQGAGHRRPSAVIHGIPVYRLPSGKGSVLYLVPRLGVRVGARGPKAARVLATLARSPLSVVLGRGAAGPVASGWSWRRFGGVRFAAPRSWSLQRAHQWATCGTGQVPGTLLLIDATRPPAALPCPYQIPTAAADEAYPGLTAVTGKYAARSVDEEFRRCRARQRARICLSSVTGQGGLFGSVLIFSVSRPHARAMTYFLLGLSGSGASARKVFDSISLAGH